MCVCMYVCIYVSVWHSNTSYISSILFSLSLSLRESESNITTIANSTITSTTTTINTPDHLIIIKQMRCASQFLKLTSIPGYILFYNMLVLSSYCTHITFLLCLHSSVTHHVGLSMTSTKYTHCLQIYTEKKSQTKQNNTPSLIYNKII